MVGGGESGLRQSEEVFPVPCGSLQECALSVTKERETETPTRAGQSINVPWIGLQGHSL